MPDPDPNVSSQFAGSPVGKPGDEKQSPGDGSGLSPESDRPSFEQVTGELANAKQQLATVEKNYADSNRAGQLNYQLQQQSSMENQRLRTRLDELERASQGEGIAPSIEEVAANLTEAAQLGESDKVAQSLSQLVTAAGNEAREKQRIEQSANEHQRLRVGESTTYLQGFQQQLGSAEDPIAKRSWELYGTLVTAKQNNTWGFNIVDDTVPYGEYQINPHILKEAHMRASAEYAQQALAGNLPPASDIAPTLQPSRPGGGAPVSGGAQNGLLTEGERATASIYNMTEEEFFAELDPRMQAARKRARKPVTNEELVMAGLASASDIDKSNQR